MTKRSIEKQESFIVYITNYNDSQFYITAQMIDAAADPVSAYIDAYSSILKIIGKENLFIVHDKIFGSSNYYKDIVNSRKELLLKNKINSELPLTFIQGNPYWGQGIAGIQIIAVSIANEDEKVWTILDGEKPCGFGWKKNGANFLMLQNICDLNNHYGENKRESQTGIMFDRAQNILHNYSGSYQNVVRTWIYIDDILDWYGEFNKVRNIKYKDFGFIPNGSGQMETERIYLPASTGIWGRNPLNAAAVMDLLAVIPEPGSPVKIGQTSGVKQRSPFWYGSAFSRAMCVREPELTTILLSGTASIDEHGHSVFIGDTKLQIHKTMGVIDALIKEENATLKDICTATVFLKRADDYPVYEKAILELGLTEIPAVCVVADVCREELLFEIDATIVHDNK
ncbi:MAG: Rid family hydrolase [bacterium]